MQSDPRYGGWLHAVSAASARLDDAERARRDVLLAARASGVPLRLIAAAAGLSASRIHSITKEEHEMTTTLELRPPAPPSTDDVLIVAAGKSAWLDFQRYTAYICQDRRSFRDVPRMGFYVDAAIQPILPTIRYRADGVEWSRSNIAALRETGSHLDAEVANVIEQSLDNPTDRRTENGRYQVFLLSAAGDADTLTLAQPVAHNARGRGSAFVQGQRYISETALRANPPSTDELPS